MHIPWQTWLARPALLACLAVVPVLAALAVLAWWRRRRALAALGMTLGVRRQVLVRASVRRWRGLLLGMATVLLAVAGAGPQWGWDDDARRAPADDLIVVLDLSRSMQAEQPSRQERAVRLLRDLAETLEQRGRRRVAVVVFAARPRLLFPLTTDYEHFRHCLQQIEADDLAPLAPEPNAPFRSGTRIGAALQLAVATLDPTRMGRQAILLLSDGDDPAAADAEWRDGVLAARANGVRIFTVGVGDPDHAHLIPEGGDVLRYQGKEVHTRLNEALLEEIAGRTGGAYLPAYTQALPLGVLMQNLLEEHSTEDTGDDGLRVVRQQYAWLLAPALALLLLSLLLHEGPRPPRATRPSRATRHAPRRMPALAAGVALSLAGARLPPNAEPLVRQGNAAFAAGDFEAALRFYDQAGDGAIDPGMVAFNRAAACYRLGRFGEAVAGYRQCLDDDQAPLPRRARARYDLGTALLKQSRGTSAALLRQAVTAFRAALAEPTLPADLVADTRHNLELARLLWLKARAADPDEPPDANEDPGRTETKPDKPGNTTPDNQGKDPGASGKPNEANAPDDGKGPPGAGDRNKVRGNKLEVLPDTDAVVPLPPAEADAQLDDIIARIRRERRAHWHQSTRLPADARNW